MRLGQDFGAAGNEIYVAFKAEEEKTNTLRAEEAFSKLRERQLQLTYGDQDGFTNKKGSQAVDKPLAKEYGDRFNQAYREIESGLGNDDQKLKFKTRATAARLQFDEGLLRHLAQENEAYAKQTTDGAIRTEVASIAANPYSSEAMAFGMERASELIRKEVARQGFTGKAATDQAEEGIRKVKDAMWVARIEAIMLKQPMTADQLFRANADQISNPAVRLQMQARTREAAFGVQGTMEAQKIIDEYRSSPERAQSKSVGMAVPADIQSLLEKPNQTKAEKEKIWSFWKEHSSPGDKGGRVLDVEGGIIVKAGGMPGADPATENTSGLPMARDIAAELPFLLTKVEKRADALYGTDPSNPDRAAFVRRVTQELQAKVAADVHQLNALQRKNQGTIIDAVTGMSAPGGMVLAGGRGGAPGQTITSFAQIQSDPRLFTAWQGMDVQAKVSVMNMIEANQRADQKGNESLYWDTWNRIHLPAGDPKKIDFYGQIIGLAGPGKLSTQQVGQLRLEIDRAETPGGRSVSQMRRAADSSVEQWFRTNLNTNMLFMEQKLTNPTAYMDWTNRWREEVGKKVDTLIADGKPEMVRNLFALDSKESVIKPEYLQTFMGAGTTLKDQADAVRQGAAPGVAPAKPPANVMTDEKSFLTWANALPPEQKTFITPEGKTMWIPGRKPATADAAPAAPVEAGKPAPGAAPAPAQPAAQPTMDATGKVVPPPAPVARAPGDAPAFGGSLTEKTPEYLQQHVTELNMDALGYALKETGKTVAWAINPLTMGRQVLDLYWAGVEKLKTLPPAMRRESARAYFTDIMAKPQFFKEDIPALQEALKYGDLTAAEKKKARTMLKAAGVE